jgi:hypothetical protein
MPAACVCTNFMGPLVARGQNIYIIFVFSLRRDRFFSRRKKTVGTLEGERWSTAEEMQEILITWWNSSSKKLPVCVFRRPLAMRKIWGMKNIRMRFLSIRAVSWYRLQGKYVSDSQIKQLLSEIVYLITIDSIITGSPRDVDQNKQKRFFFAAFN